jgi:hypothetical protein
MPTKLFYRHSWGLFLTEIDLMRERGFVEEEGGLVGGGEPKLPGVIKKGMILDDEESGILYR